MRLKQVSFDRMRIKLNFDYVFNLRGIKKKYTFFKKIGLTHNIAARLASNDGASINLTHLTKACMVLHCTPNDLLDFEGSDELSDEHPLQTLKKDSSIIESIEKLRTLPPGNLNQIKAFIEELEK